MVICTLSLYALYDIQLFVCQSHEHYLLQQDLESSVLWSLQSHEVKAVLTPDFSTNTYILVNSESMSIILKQEN
jgi:hypothetical protein